MRKHLLIVAILAFALIIPSGLGCAIPGLGGGGKPTVTIIAPPSGSQVQVGQEIAIQSVSTHSEGVVRVDLIVDGVLTRSDASANPKGEPSLTVAQGWTPQTQGTHLIVVQAYSSRGDASDPVSITLNAVPAQEAAVPTPTPSSTAQATPTQEAPQAGCNDSAFVADMTVPDGTSFAPGASFAKTWRLKNTGTCAWGSGYQLAFVGGAQMGAAPSVSVMATPAGAMVDVTVSMFAPTTPGAYTGRWQMRSPEGALFGQVVTVVINVPGVTPSPSPSVTATPPGEVEIKFWADKETITQGQCTTIRWKVKNAQAVYYQEGGVVGESEREECPGITRTYKLRVVHAGGETTKELTITVQPTGPAEDNFKNFTVTEETSDTIRIRVDYDYVSDHGDRVAITAWAYSGGSPLPEFGFGCVPGTARPGSGSTEVELVYHGAGPVSSNRIELRMIQQGGSPFDPGFYSKRFDYSKEWVP